MKRRKKFMLLIVVVLASMLLMFLTACGCSSDDTKVNYVSLPFETEATTQKVKETEATETTTQKVKETETNTQEVKETEATTQKVEETTVEVKLEYGNFQIQSLQGVKLDENPELPCKLMVYSEATEAVDNPLKITVESEDNRGKISFSFIGSDTETFNSIKKGIIMENNQDITYTRSNVSHMGDIATFSVTVPLNLENATTAIYELSFKNGDENYNGYVAFAFTITQ